MTKLMITVTTADAKPQWLWVTLPDMTSTFDVTVASSSRTVTHHFDGQARLLYHGHVVALRSGVSRRGPKPRIA